MLPAMDSFQRAGMTFDVRDAGPADGQPVVLLHGFPQGSESWDDVTPRLNAAGYRTLAPDQRGYSPRARPLSRRDYAMDELVADVLALADAANAERFHLVGHDWGGGVAWAVATAAPERLHSLTSVSTPHPRAMTDAMLRSSQLLRSWYMLLFQLPRLPEKAILSRGGAQFVRQLTAEGLPEDKVRGYLARLQQPGAATAEINWYRALVVSLTANRSAAPVRVPTLYVWSDGDRYLGRTAADLTRRYVDAPYRFEVLTGVNHWIPELAAEHLAALLLDHFEQRAT